MKSETASQTLHKPLKDLIVDQGFSPRAEVDLDLVKEYQQVLGKLPPVSVWLYRGKLYLVDGFHRYSAHAEAGAKSIPCVLVGSGDLTKALDFADTANTRHGARLSRLECREVARRFKKRHPRWSARKVARLIGIAHTTVLAAWEKGCGVGRIHRPDPTAPVLVAAPVLVRSVPATGAMHHHGITCPNCGHLFEAAA